MFPLLFSKSSKEGGDCGGESGGRISDGSRGVAEVIILTLHLRVIGYTDLELQEHY